jgi:hypothetical protein
MTLDHIGVGGEAKAGANANDPNLPRRDQTSEDIRSAPQTPSSSPSKPAAEGNLAPLKLDLDEQKMSVVIITTLAALVAYIPALEDLAKAALEPNVYYEPWMLIPSLKAFGAGKQFVFALIFAPTIVNQKGRHTLCGFFPMVRERGYKGLPVPILRLWQHRYGPLCTPLIREGRAEECLQTFFDWLADANHPSRVDCPILELRDVTGDGPFNDHLVDYLFRSAKLSYLEDRHLRALFRPAESAEAYLNKALSGRRRKEMRAQARRLSEQGKIEFTDTVDEAEVDIWLSDFLNLEAGGWKGKEGSAIASKHEDKEFFIEVAREGYRRGRLRMLSLKLDGKPIAQKLDVTTGRVSFAFKIAYNEEYARFSPGVLLEMENLRRLHNPPLYDWVDSCAITLHFMINRLFTSRRVIQTILIATGRRPGGLIVSALPLLRWFNRLIRRPAAYQNDQD